MSSYYADESSAKTILPMKFFFDFNIENPYTKNKKNKFFPPSIFLQNETTLKRTLFKFSFSFNYLKIYQWIKKIHFIIFRFTIRGIPGIIVIL